MLLLLFFFFPSVVLFNMMIIIIYSQNMTFDFHQTPEALDDECWQRCMFPYTSHRAAQGERSIVNLIFGFSVCRRHSKKQLLFYSLFCFFPPNK